MKQVVVAYGIGIVFALGLGIAGMTQPAKILGFLDVTGYWDPSLMFVMVGAIAVTFSGYRWIFKRGKPLWANRFYLPEKTKLDKRLLLGAALFGIGWGLGGYCPGPAVTALVSGLPSAWVFVLAMVAGFYLYRSVDKWMSSS